MRALKKQKPGNLSHTLKPGTLLYKSSWVRRILPNQLRHQPGPQLKIFYFLNDRDRQEGPFRFTYWFCMFVSMLLIHCSQSPSVSTPRKSMDSSIDQQSTGQIIVDSSPANELTPEEDNPNDVATDGGINDATIHPNEEDGAINPNPSDDPNSKIPPTESPSNQNPPEENDPEMDFENGAMGLEPDECPPSGPPLNDFCSFFPNETCCSNVHP